MQFKLCYETGQKVEVTLRDSTKIIATVDSYKRVTQDFHTRLDLCVEYQDTKGDTKYMWVPDYRTTKV